MQSRWVSNSRVPAAPTKLEQEVTAPYERRTKPRFSISQHVELCVPKLVMAAELVNLSDHGAKLRIASGLVPAIGRRVMIRLLDRTLVTGVTRWNGQQDIGVEFLANPINAEDHLFPDSLGQLYYALIVQQQRRLAVL
jgi:hypothetical protein